MKADKILFTIKLLLLLEISYIAISIIGAKLFGFINYSEWTTGEKIQFFTAALTCIATLIVGFMAYYVARQQKTIQAKATNDAVNLSLFEHRIKCIEELGEFSNSIIKLELESIVEIITQFTTLEKKVFLLFDISENDDTYFNFAKSASAYGCSKIKHLFMAKYIDSRLTLNILDNEDNANYMDTAIHLLNRPNIPKYFFNDFAPIFKDLRSQLLYAYFRDEIDLQGFSKLSYNDAINKVEKHTSDFQLYLDDLFKKSHLCGTNFDDSLAELLKLLTALTKKSSTFSIVK
jgi:hypothetical protein